MIDLSNKTVLVWDLSGSYVYVAERLAQDFSSVLYFSQWQSGFSQVKDFCPGIGLENIERIADPFAKLDRADMIFFTDVGHGDLQEFLKKEAYPVFGSGAAQVLEIDRALLKNTIEVAGMASANAELVTGIDALTKLLRAAKDKYVKFSFFRGDMECVDAQTEIFTPTGWKSFADINEGEEVLTMDLDSRDSFFKPIDHYFKSYYEGKMYEVTTRKVDLLVTPKHKFFARTKTNIRKWNYAPICEIEEELRRPNSSFISPVWFNWNGEEIAQVTIERAPNANQKNGSWAKYRKMKRATKNLPMDLWLKIAGWFVSEGSLTLAGKEKNRYRTNITQSKVANRPKWDAIESLLKETGYNFQYEEDRGFSIYDKALWLRLCEFYNPTLCKVCGNSHCAHNKAVPQYIKNLSSRQIRLFLETMLAGDGCVDRGVSKYHTSSPTLADDLQELIFKTGKVGTIRTRKQRVHTWHGRMIMDRCPAYIVTECKADAYIQKKHIKKKDYKGLIYDVEINPHHSIFIRRNGKCVWTGNTYHHKKFFSTETWLHNLAVQLGPYGTIAEFLVEDPIEGDACEVGLDTFAVDGHLPEQMLWGYEVKDSSYLGTTDPLPARLDKHAEELSPILRAYNYRGILSTEIRVTESDLFLIDFTARCPSPPMEVECCLMNNFSQVIYEGAHGRMLEPDYQNVYAAELILRSDWIVEHPLALEIGDKDRVMIHGHFKIEGKDYAVVPEEFSEFGAACGIGNTVEDAVGEALQAAESVTGHQVKYDADGFSKAIECVKEGQALGIDWFNKAKIVRERIVPRESPTPLAQPASPAKTVIDRVFEYPNRALDGGRNEVATKDNDTFFKPDIE